MILIRYLFLLSLLLSYNFAFAQALPSDLCRGHGCVTEGPYAGLASKSSGPTVTFTAPNTIVSTGGWSGFFAGDTFEVSGSANNDGKLFMIENISTNTVTTIHGNVANESGAGISIQEQPTIMIVGNRTHVDANGNYYQVFWNGFSAGEKQTRNGVPVIVTSLRKAVTFNDSDRVPHNNLFVLFETSGDFEGCTPGHPTCVSQDLEIHMQGNGMWVAGQTAPAPGVRIRGYWYYGGSSDTIYEHLNINDGDITDAQGDTSVCGQGISICGGTAAFSPLACGFPSPLGCPNNVVVRHVTARWGSDETLSISQWGEDDSRPDPNNVSIINSLFAEGMWDDSKCIKADCITPSMKGGVNLMYMAGTNISFIDNVMANTSARAPYSNRGSGSFFVANNLNYNTPEPEIQTHQTDSIYITDWVSNIVVDATDDFYNSTGNQLYDYFLWFEVDKNCFEGSKFYVNGNVVDAGYDALKSPQRQSGPNDWTTIGGSAKPGVRVRDIFGRNCGWGSDGQAMFNDVGVSTPSVQPAGWVDRLQTDWTDIWKYLITEGCNNFGCVGARPQTRDTADARIIQEIKNEVSGMNYKINPQKGDLDWGVLDVNTITLSIPPNPHVVAVSGFTNLEEYLHNLSRQVEGLSSPPVPPSPLPEKSLQGVTLQ